MAWCAQFGVAVNPVIRMRVAGTPATIAFAGYVLGHDGSGADDRAVADRHSREDRDSSAEPGVVADDDRRRDHVGSPVGVNAVVERCQRAAVADEGAVPDGDASRVLEPAADVDEDVLADVQVLAELAVEGWKYGDGVVHRVAGELRKQGPHLLGCVVSGVGIRC